MFQFTDYKALCQMDLNNIPLIISAKSGEKRTVSSLLILSTRLLQGFECVS